MESLDLIYNHLLEIQKEINKLDGNTDYLNRKNKKDFHLESIAWEFEKAHKEFYEYKREYEFNTNEPDLGTIVDDPYNNHYELVFDDTSTSGMFSTCGWRKRKK